MIIEIFSRIGWHGKRWYFRIKGKNHRIVAQSEAYKNRGECAATARLIRADAFDAEIRNLS